MKSPQLFLNHLFSKTESIQSPQTEEVERLRKVVRHWGLDEARWFDGVDQHDLDSLIQLDDLFGRCGLERELWNGLISFTSHDGTQLHPDDIIEFMLRADTKMDKSEFLGRLISVLVMQVTASSSRMDWLAPVVRFLVEHGANINVFDSEPLSIAVQTGGIGWIKALLDSGAKPTHTIIDSIDSQHFMMRTKLYPKNMIPDLRGIIRKTLEEVHHVYQEQECLRQLVVDTNQTQTQPTKKRL